MADKRAKHKGRKGSGPYLGILHSMIDSPAYISLSSWSAKLIMDLGRQYTGFNNGDLCAPYSLMQHRGWNSPSTLNKALKELQDKGFITLTRQGGRNRCNLYAVTWAKIDECKGKLDVKPTSAPSNTWKTYSG